MHMQSCCFAYLNLLKFPVLVAVAIVRRVPPSRIRTPKPYCLEIAFQESDHKSG